MSGTKKGFMAFVVMALFFAGATFGIVFLSTDLFSGRPVEAEAAQVDVKEAVTNEVCMVTDRVFGKPQIPIEFEGKTYYGCCEGCVARIKGDRSVRYSTDPVTLREVDKATAFITEGPGGEALYFESIDSAREYLTSTRD